MVPPDWSVCLCGALPISGELAEGFEVATGGVASRVGLRSGGGSRGEKGEDRVL